MIDIWPESSSFDKTNQILADKTRLIFKKCCFMDIELLEIYEQTHREEYAQDRATRNETPYRESQKNKTESKSLILKTKRPQTSATKKQMLTKKEKKYCKVNEEIHNLNEVYFTVPRKRRLEKSQGRYRKGKKYYKIPKGQHHQNK